MRLRLILAALTMLVCALAPAAARAEWEHLAGKTVIAEFEEATTKNSNMFGRTQYKCRVDIHGYFSKEGNLFYSEVTKSCVGAIAGVPTSTEQGYVFGLDGRSGTIDLLGGTLDYKVGSSRDGVKLDLAYAFSATGPFGPILKTSGTASGKIEITTRGNGCSIKRAHSGTDRNTLETSVERETTKKTYKLLSCRVVEGKR